MNVLNSVQLKSWALVCGCLFLGTQRSACAAEGDDGVTAVASKASKDYVRARLPDGTFQPEYYSFGKGGYWGGEIRDPTIDELSFLNVAHVIAVPLAGQKYFPAMDPKKAGLLIMLYWGTTAVPMPTQNSAVVQDFRDAQDNLNRYISRAPSGKEIVGGGGLADAALAQWSAALTMLNLANQQRSQENFLNAAMLGYDAPGLIGTDFGHNNKGGPLGVEQADLVSEIEENRYFVVLMAYDFQLLWKEKKHELLWETRFSIRERNHQFDRDLPAMAQYASQYFGQDSHGLIRKWVPLGRVEFGELKSLGEVSDKPGPGTAQPPFTP